MKVKILTVGEWKAGLVYSEAYRSQAGDRDINGSHLVDAFCMLSSIQILYMH